MSCQTSCWSSSSCTVSPLSLLGGPRRQRGRGRGLDAQALIVQAELPENSGPLPTRAALTLSPGGRGNISLVLFIDSSIQAGVSPETHSPLPAGPRCQTGPQTVPAPPAGLGPGGWCGQLGSRSYKR